MKKAVWKLIGFLIVCLAGYIFYYITLPAINIHSQGLWWFVIFLFAAMCIFCVAASIDKNQRDFRLNTTKFKKSFINLTGFLTVVIIIVFIVGSLMSSTLFNAKKYKQLINIKNGDFTQDIEQISYSEIPVLDKDSAALIGNRKMGTMVEYISQYEVAPDYTQINIKGKPVRVTPLEYGSILKWFTNRSEGIPAYIKIDMTTQDAECVKLNEGMKYTESDHFGRNIHRYLRFKFPTYIFGTLNFETDDNGTPYWVCPVKDYTIGLFGGETISNVVLVNAITGEYTNYKANEVPSWVDRVYSAELLISYYNYYGTLQHGYWNSVLSQKDCLKTTDGYNYLALGEDIWVYTGVTSVGKDQSNVGFILMNQRTAETKYYAVSGAQETSAMSSAEGKVQHLGYKSTFPILLNIANEPTYFMSLKDAAGLVKKYAMVNVSKYTIVAIGDTVPECEKDYMNQLKANNIGAAVDSSTLPSVSGTISKIAQAVVEGNSHYYIMIQGNDKIFDVTVGDNIGIIKYNVGDTITLKYTEGEKVNTVVGIQ